MMKAVVLTTQLSCLWYTEKTTENIDSNYFTSYLINNGSINFLQGHITKSCKSQQ
jgi:hypothetical protein